jgi:hypothetical protein
MGVDWSRRQPLSEMRLCMDPVYMVYVDVAMLERVLLISGCDVA